MVRFWISAANWQNASELARQQHGPVWPETALDLTNHLRALQERKEHVSGEGHQVEDHCESGLTLSSIVTCSTCRISSTETTEWLLRPSGRSVWCVFRKSKTRSCCHADTCVCVTSAPRSCECRLTSVLSAEQVSERWGQMWRRSCSSSWKDRSWTCQSDIYYDKLSFICKKDRKAECSPFPPGTSVTSRRSTASETGVRSFKDSSFHSATLLN